MADWWQALGSAFGQELGGWAPDPGRVARVVLRVALTPLFGGLLGLQREQRGKEAGLRTHMLVALGAALFGVSAAEAGLGREQLGQVFEGVAAGIGFIGGGVILKLTDRREVQGLTTAAGLWITAAIGLAVGLGHYGPALLGAACGLLILILLRPLERPKQSATES